MNLIILCGYILLVEHLLRCASWSKLGVNGCFVPEADKTDIIMYQSTRRKPVNWLVGDGNELSKVVAPASAIGDS